jgi:hypothetical protein
MSGGNPRWFIHLINALSHREGRPIPASEVVAEAKELPQNTLWPYLNNLKVRLRSKRKYIESALQLAHILIEGLREVNRGTKRDSTERPTCFVAVSTHKTVPYRVHAALRLLQYAGIIYSRGPCKITARETAERFLIHPAIQLRENTLFGGEVNPPVEAVVAALSDPFRNRFKEFTKNSPALLEFGGEEEVEATNCRRCGITLPEGSRFCLQCGAPQLESSPFEELLGAPVGELELTPGIKARVVADGRFQTVNSVLRASNEELDSIHGIGSERIKLIRYAAEEFVAG